MSIQFTEDEFVNGVNQYAKIEDRRILPRIVKHVRDHNTKCSWCGAPSFPYATCQKHREWGSIRRQLKNMMDKGLVEKVNDGRGRKGGAVYKNTEKAIKLFQKKPFVRGNPKIRRNDPCPCGSQKKYKQCCLRRQS